MALQVNYTDLKTGVIIQNAYVRVFSGSFRRTTDESKYSVGMNLQIFASSDTEMQPAFVANISAGLVDVDEPILASQFYEYLKSLPQFAGALDV